MRVPSASWWSGRSLSPALLLLVFCSAVFAAPAGRLIADDSGCFVQQGSEVIFELTNECTKASATLSFPGEKLTFVIEYGGGDLYTRGNFTVGGCRGQFKVVQKLKAEESIDFGLSYNGQTQVEPYIGEASASSVKIGKKASECGAKLEDADGGKKTTVSFDMTNAAPGLVFKFTATLEKKEESEGAGWTVEGWKLWAAVGGCALLLLAVIALVAVGFFCWRRKKKTAAADKKPSSKSRRNESQKQARSLKKALGGSKCAKPSKEKPKTMATAKEATEQTPAQSNEASRPSKNASKPTDRETTKQNTWATLAEPKETKAAPKDDLRTAEPKDEPKTGKNRDGRVGKTKMFTEDDFTAESATEELERKEMEANRKSAGSVVQRAKGLRFDWREELEVPVAGIEGVRKMKLLVIFDDPNTRSEPCYRALVQHFPLNTAVRERLLAVVQQAEREASAASYEESKEWKNLTQLLNALHDEWTALKTKKFVEEHKKKQAKGRSKQSGV